MGKQNEPYIDLENQEKALKYIKRCIENKADINENIILNIHKIVTEGIFPGGQYRSGQVYISNSDHTPPPGERVPNLMKNFCNDLQNRSSVIGLPESGINPFELAVWSHAELTRIHPFKDGNGRTARLVMNYILIQNDYLKIAVPPEWSESYFNSLEHYDKTGDIEPLLKIMVTLEAKELENYTRQATAKKNEYIKE